MKFYNVISKIKNIYNLLFFTEETYFIEEINVQTNKVIIRYRGTRTIIKADLGSIISDAKIIDGLSPEQACLIGGYFGRVLRKSLESNKALKKAKRLSFLLKNNRGQYRIVFENRSGEVGYLDQKTKKEFIEHPLTMAKNSYIISKFDPSQACYIGILAGISMEKAIHLDEKTGQHNLDDLLKKHPKLRLIK